MELDGVEVGEVTTTVEAAVSDEDLALLDQANETEEAEILAEIEEDMFEEFNDMLDDAAEEALDDILADLAAECPECVNPVVVEESTE